MMVPGGPADGVQQQGAREQAMQLQRRYYLTVIELVDESAEKQCALSLGADGVSALRAEPPAYQQAALCFEAALRCCSLDPATDLATLSNPEQLDAGGDGGGGGGDSFPVTTSRWRATRRCAVRAGWPVESRVLEVLELGQVVLVAEHRAGRLRLAHNLVGAPPGPAGWVSVWDSEGDARLLERVDPPEPAASALPHTLTVFALEEAAAAAAAGHHPPPLPLPHEPAGLDQQPPPLPQQAWEASTPAGDGGQSPATSMTSAAGPPPALLAEPVDLEQLRALLMHTTAELQSERLARATAEHRSREAARTAYAAAQAAQAAQQAAQAFEQSDRPDTAASSSPRRRWSPGRRRKPGELAAEFGTVRLGRGVCTAVADLWGGGGAAGPPLLRRALGLLLFGVDRPELEASGASGVAAAAAAAGLSLDEVWTRVREFAEELPLDPSTLASLLAATAGKGDGGGGGVCGGGGQRRGGVTVGDVLRALEEVVNGAMDALLSTLSATGSAGSYSGSTPRGEQQCSEPPPPPSPSPSPAAGLEALRARMAMGGSLSGEAGNGLAAMLDSTIQFGSSLSVLHAGTTDDPTSILYASPDRPGSAGLQIRPPHKTAGGGGGPSLRVAADGRQQPPPPPPSAVVVRQRLLQQAVAAAVDKAVAGRLARLQMVPAAERSNANRATTAVVAAATDAAAAAAAATVGQAAEMEAAVVAAELRGRRSAEESMSGRLAVAEAEAVERQDTAVAAARQSGLAQGLAEGRQTADASLARLRGQQQWELRQLQLQLSASAAVSASAAAGDATALSGSGGGADSPRSAGELAVELARSESEMAAEVDAAVSVAREEAAGELRAVQASAERAAVAAAEVAVAARERAGEELRAEVGREVVAAEAQVAAARIAGAAEIERFGHAASAQLRAVQAKHKVSLRTVAGERVAEAERRADLRLESARQELEGVARLERRQLEAELARVQLEHHRALGEVEERSAGVLAEKVAGLEAEATAALQATWAELEAANLTLDRAKAAVKAAARNPATVNRHARRTRPTDRSARSVTSTSLRGGAGRTASASRTTSAARGPRVSQPSPLRGRPSQGQTSLAASASSAATRSECQPFPLWLLTPNCCCC